MCRAIPAPVQSCAVGGNSIEQKETQEIQKRDKRTARTRSAPSLEPYHTESTLLTEIYATAQTRLGAPEKTGVQHIMERSETSVSHPEHIATPHLQPRGLCPRVVGGLGEEHPRAA